MLLEMLWLNWSDVNCKLHQREVLLLSMLVYWRKACSTLNLEETDAVPVICAEVIREGGSDEVATADGIYVQTDLKKLDLEQVLEDCDVRVAESNDRKSIFSVFDMLCYEDG